MKTSNRIIILLILIFISLVAGSLWVAISGWPPIIVRDHKYQALLVGFRQAQRSEFKREDKDARWDFEIRESAKPTIIRVWTQAGVVRIKYDDESVVRSLYEHRDYNGVLEIRTTGNVLYVYWYENLLHAKHWLLAYDLNNRQEIARRRINPSDLAQD